MHSGKLSREKTFANWWKYDFAETQIARFCRSKRPQLFILKSISCTIIVYTKPHNLPDKFEFSLMSHAVQIDLHWGYHTVGNFRGRKLSQILQFCGYLQKFSPQNLGAWRLLERQKRAICVSAKIIFLPIRESFLPWKFPTIQYTSLHCLVTLAVPHAD